jgi:tetratricopeptide (TPR) repeat protein
MRPLPPDPRLRTCELATRLKATQLRGVFVSDRIASAMATGFLRPLVLIPTPWLGQLSPEILEAVIAHELAHIGRKDLWINLGQRIVEALLFYHPAVWWLSRRITMEREKCCDELAAGVRGPRGSLLERVRYVLGMAPSREPLGWWLVPLVVMVAALAVAALTISPLAASLDPRRAQILGGLEKIERCIADLRSSVQALVDDGTLRNAQDDFEGESARFNADRYYELGRYELAAKGYVSALSRSEDAHERRELLEKTREAHRKGGKLGAAIEAQKRLIAEAELSGDYSAMRILANLESASEALRRRCPSCDAGSGTGDQLWTLNYRAWYVELAQGATAGLQAYRDVDDLSAEFGMSDSRPAKKCRNRIERLERILTRRAKESHGNGS